MVRTKKKRQKRLTFSVCKDLMVIMWSHLLIGTSPKAEKRLSTMIINSVPEINFQPLGLTPDWINWLSRTDKNLGNFQNNQSQRSIFSLWDWSQSSIFNLWDWSHSGNLFSLGLVPEFLSSPTFELFRSGTGPRASFLTLGLVPEQHFLIWD